MRCRNVHANCDSVAHAQACLPMTVARPVVSPEDTVTLSRPPSPRIGGHECQQLVPPPAQARESWLHHGPQGRSASHRGRARDADEGRTPGARSLHRSPARATWRTRSQSARRGPVTGRPGPSTLRPAERRPLDLHLSRATQMPQPGCSSPPSIAGFAAMAARSNWTRTRGSQSCWRASRPLTAARAPSNVARISPWQRCSEPGPPPTSPPPAYSALPQARAER